MGLGGRREGHPQAPWWGWLSKPATPGTEASPGTAGGIAAEGDVRIAGSQAATESAESRCGRAGKTCQGVQLAAPRVTQPLRRAEPAGFLLEKATSRNRVK